MKKTVLLLLPLLVSVVGYAQTTSVLAPQKGVGTLYGTRDSVACKSKKEPAKGGPSAELATDYVRCGREGVSTSDHSLTLWEKVQLDIGKGRPYQASDSRLQEIDPAEPVFPIRATFDLYRCFDPARMTPVQPGPGHNCNFNPNVHGTGVCYKTTFSDWNCEMGYDFDFRATQRNVPGPK